MMNSSFFHYEVTSVKKTAAGRLQVVVSNLVDDMSDAGGDAGVRVSLPEINKPRGVKQVDVIHVGLFHRNNLDQRRALLAAVEAAI